MKLTYEQACQFLARFTNQELDDAQVIARHCHEALGKSYNQVLLDVLIEMRKEQLVS
jgi:hypothetical protein